MREESWGEECRDRHKIRGTISPPALITITWAVAYCKDPYLLPYSHRHQFVYFLSFVSYFSFATVGKYAPFPLQPNFILSCPIQQSQWFLSFHLSLANCRDCPWTQKGVGDKRIVRLLVILCAWVCFCACSDICMTLLDCVYLVGSCSCYFFWSLF